MQGAKHLNPVAHIDGDAMTRDLVASNRVMALWNTMIGKKVVMAVTGVVLVGFVIAHMLGNLKIFSGPNEINTYSRFLREVGRPEFGYGQLLWIVRIVLLIYVVLHVTAAIQLTRMSWVARPIGYTAKRDIETTFAARMARATQENEGCRRLIAIPGVGPVTATALMAAIGNGAAFRKGREFSAWVGMVPKEVSTGGKQKLLGISKRGNAYLRRLFVQGARAVMMRRTKQSPALNRWLEKLAIHKHHNVAIVALANKLARIAWAVLAKGEAYRPALLADGMST
jgi:hypothetical protein